MTKTMLQKGLLAIVFLLPIYTQALEVDIYGGMGTGYAVQKQASGDDTTDGGEKAYLGSRFLGPIGIEIAYYNLGKYNSKNDEVTAAGAFLVLNLDIRGMTLFAKGGVAQWTQKDLTTEVKQTGEDFAFGAGINLPVDRHVLFRTELEFFNNVGKDEPTNLPGKDMWLLSFGVNFRF